MSELRLDSDEIDNVLYCLKKERDAAPSEEKPYREYLGSIILKVEAFAAIAYEADRFEALDSIGWGRR